MYNFFDDDNDQLTVRYQPGVIVDTDFMYLEAIIHLAEEGNTCPFSYMDELRASIEANDEKSSEYREWLKNLISNCNVGGDRKLDTGGKFSVTLECSGVSTYEKHAEAFQKNKQSHLMDRPYLSIFAKVQATGSGEEWKCTEILAPGVGIMNMVDVPDNDLEHDSRAAMTPSSP